ncbi:hypothetical protein ACQ4LE_008312 [Meloidogyne hapla]|uniref:Clathrin light chain n=1 Tax=Meloidogyne hapla TaxID=6305 RepID=A0A1I8B8X1_MELHA
MEFIGDEDTKAFFANLGGSYSNEEESDSSVSGDDVINDTAEFFDQLELAHPDDKSVCENVSEEVNEDISVNEYISEEKFDELLLKWRELQDKKRKFFTTEVKKMEVDVLSDRMKKFSCKWSEYEDETKRELRKELELM